MKKGFTLVELIGVIILIGVLSLIAVPVVNNTIRNSKQKAYEAQVATIIEAANKWSVKNVDKLSDEKITYVSINELISEGFIENDENSILKNPLDNSEMTGCVAIKYVLEYNQYTYEYSDVCE